jgi:hypothetical protein
MMNGHEPEKVEFSINCKGNDCKFVTSNAPLSPLPCRNVIIGVEPVVGVQKAGMNNSYVMAASFITVNFPGDMNEL